MDGVLGWLATARNWVRGGRTAPRIGLALGGGFARGIAHIGVLRTLEREEIPIHCVSGVSAGSIVAAAFASGKTADQIEAMARILKFRDVAGWKLSRFGLAGSERMGPFLERLLKSLRFEHMQRPLAVVATDLGSGAPVVFRGKGDVVVPIRASCAYPGLFLPIRMDQRWLVDGMVSMAVPARPLRDMGATHVISVSLPNPSACDPDNLFSVVGRCFQIMSSNLERDWREHSNLVIEPAVSGIGWDGFENASELITAGETAAKAAIPFIREWLSRSARPVEPRLRKPHTPLVDLD